ncbi:DNA alkylation repair protein [Phormidium sp. FACHB-322]|uniref:DNA alkylation repair protein n=1 Tax=unclassified Phormidium TaxID=2609805 RepID=UPI0016895C60|nr:DNA alkylation repair protein [Phormidium sp. FACHB-77]MBD2031997.1 DNA alkylation repair protein [Phormidium sp. FACHB-322]MBD2053960.1 DNA alkylation repair protein [Leptolyngbya sp. FACHB-60]
MEHPDCKNSVTISWRNQILSDSAVPPCYFSWVTRPELIRLCSFLRSSKTKTLKKFFIQNVVGWTLRDYSKTASEAIQAFVAETLLAPSVSKKLRNGEG